jgi:hypothetical protein
MNGLVLGNIETGHHGSYHQIWGFPVRKKHALRLNQSNELLLLILDDQIIVI